jgi:hypothetical protein
MVDEERDRDTNDHPTEQPETQRQRVGEHGDNRCRDRPGERRPLAAEAAKMPIREDTCQMTQLASAPPV